MNISIVIPFLNEEESLPELYIWIKKVLQREQLSHEIIFVNDGSTDNSVNAIKSIYDKDSCVKLISFDRNYGKSQALNSAFKLTKGSVVFTMDADLQDSPDEIPQMYKMITEQGFDLISGWKKDRKDPILAKNIPSKLFNFFARKTSGIYLHDFNCGLKAYKSEVVKNIDVYGEMHRYIPVLAKNAGFDKIGEKIVIHKKRKYGETKFGLDRFTNGFLDLISLYFITKFGKSPMYFFGFFGVLMFLSGMISAGYIGINKLYRMHYDLKTILVTDNPWFYISLACMIMGVQMFLAGFIAELIAQKNRKTEKRYNIKEKINL